MSAIWLAPVAFALAQAPYLDRTHPSRVFGQERNYRLFLPPAYASGAARYPVIYYFHGHSDRYTLERYDEGKDTVPKIAAFVARNNAIVVAVDGYVAEHYQGFYGGTPWDVYQDGGKWDFGEYFQELVAHIDSTLRTLPGRRHRATSGLSMGGFMSLYLSARYPHLIGSASAFNPGPEFYAGDPGRRVLWRPKDHVAAHTGTPIRLIRASGDYISQYHEETRDAYARATAVAFEFRQDEYHRHWATSIGETFDFHARAFADPALDAAPEVFHHDNAYARFSVWDWRVESTGGAPGYTSLAAVTRSGLRVTTRRWAPDGPAIAVRRIELLTPPHYRAGETYTLTDLALASGRVHRTTLTADSSGRLRFEVDGAGHQLAIEGPGLPPPPPVLLPVTTKDRLRVRPGAEAPFPLRIFNPRREPIGNLRVELTSEYPTVALRENKLTIPAIAPGAIADLTSIRALFTAGEGDYAPARLKLSIGAASEDIDILIEPAAAPAPLDIQVLDGRTATFAVFRQKGNQGGGATLSRTVTEGKGNGNGVLEPGEEATIWVKLAQGLDPFDKGHWYRAKVYPDSPWLTEIDDLEEQKQREWTGAKERTSLVRLAADAPPGAAIPVALSNESWSFHFTPDVRYGREPLYQAFQRHRRHVHRYRFVVPKDVP